MAAKFFGFKETGESSGSFPPCVVVTFLRYFKVLFLKIMTIILSKTCYDKYATGFQLRSVLRQFQW